MKKLLSSILASTLLLSTVGTSFAMETTENKEHLQEIHSETLSTTNFPTVSQLPDYAVKAFTTVLDTLPHTYTENGDTGTLYTCFFDYLGNGDPLMYTMYYETGVAGMVNAAVWGAKPDGTPVKLNNDNLTGSALYQGKTYLVSQYLSFPSTATMYSYAKGVFTQEGNDITWEPYSDSTDKSYTLKNHLMYQPGGAAPDATPEFDKYGNLASVTAAELKAGTSMVTGTTDVASNAWYAPYVEFVLKNEAMQNLIVDYRESNTFAPDAQATRYVVADALRSAHYNTLNFFGASGEQNLLPFTDIDYDFDVEFVYKNGIMTGMSDTYFGVNEPITREQLALVLQNLAKYVNYYKAPSSTSLSQFSDSSSISSWAKDGVTWAVANGYLSGSDGKLNPQGYLSRAELATVMTSFYQKNGMPVEKR